MAITRETKVIDTRGTFTPDDYTAPAQVYVPSSDAISVRNREMHIPKADYENADNETAFSSLLTAIDTEFGTNVLPTLGIDAAETIDLLIEVIFIEYLPEGWVSQKLSYATDVEGVRVVYNVKWEESA